MLALARAALALTLMAWALAASATEQQQLRRGPASQVQAMTPAQGEVVDDTTNNRLFLGDGSTPGGYGVVMQHDLGAAGSALIAAANAAAARASLGAAASGVNPDITALMGLASPLDNALGGLAGTPFYGLGAATAAASMAARAGHAPNVIDDFSAKHDGQVVGVVATLASGSNALAVSAPLFSAGDVGKVFGLSAAGATQSTGPVSSIPLTTNGLTCTGSTPPNIVIGGGGSYASAGFVYSLASATGAGGTGYTNGETLTLASAGGTPAQIVVTASGGVVTGVSSVAVAGSFQLQSLMTGVTATGATGSGASFALTVSLTGVHINTGGINYPVSGTTATIAGGSCATAPVAGTPVVTATVSTLAGTITSYVDAEHVTLSVNAANAVSGSAQKLVYGHDDASAFAACAATGDCHVPLATYLVGAAAMPNGGALIGHASVGYTGDVAGDPAAGQYLVSTGPVLIASPLAANALSVLGVAKVRLEGLFIDCVDYQRDGISSGGAAVRMKYLTVTRCYYGLGSSNATSDYYQHGDTIIDSEFAANIYGISNLIDSAVLFGGLSANVVGASFWTGANGNSLDHVRVEWNSGEGVGVYQAGLLTITGGLYDRNSGCGLALSSATDVQVSNVQFRRNGANNDFVYNAGGDWCATGGGDLTFSNVKAITGVNDNGTGALTPAYVGSYNTGGGMPLGVRVDGDVSNGSTLSTWQTAPASGFAFDGLGADQYRNSQRPYVANGEVAQTLDTQIGTIAVGATASATLGQSSWTSTYESFSRELILTAVNYNSPYQQYSCRVNLEFYDSTSVAAPYASACYGEAGSSGTSGTFTWGTSSELQGSISSVASDGSSFTFSVKNGGSDASIWGVWARLQ